MEGPLEASFYPGKKRHADDDLAHEQPLAKRFNLLNLGISLIHNLTIKANAKLQRTMVSSTYQSDKPRQSSYIM